MLFSFLFRSNQRITIPIDADNDYDYDDNDDDDNDSFSYHAADDAPIVVVVVVVYYRPLDFFFAVFSLAFHFISFVAVCSVCVRLAQILSI